jgi:ABC-type glycerol-3-phosphate transport system permease component
MAGGLIATAPLVLTFVLFQRHFVSGMTAGAVKG